MDPQQKWMIWLSVPLVLAWSFSLARVLANWPGTWLRKRLPFRARGLDLAVVGLAWIGVQTIGGAQNPYAISQASIVDWPRLLTRLATEGPKEAPTPAHRVWQLLPSELRGRIVASAKTPDTALETDVAAALTELLHKSDLYVEGDFAAVPLTEQFRHLLAEPGHEFSDSQILRLNRSLLEESFSGLLEPSIRPLLLTVVLRSLLMIFLAPLLLWMTAKVRPYQLGIHCRRPISSALFGLSQLVVWLPIALLTSGLARAYWPQETFNPVQNFFFSSAPSVLDWTLVISSAAIVAPLFEELLFRSILQTWLVNWLGLPVGIFLAGAFFGLAHSSSWPDPLPLTLLGVALGLTYQRTRSLWAPVAMHGGFNGIMVLIGALSGG